MECIALIWDDVCLYDKSYSKVKVKSRKVMEPEPTHGHLSLYTLTKRALVQSEGKKAGPSGAARVYQFRCLITFSCHFSGWFITEQCL